MAALLDPDLEKVKRLKLDEVIRNSSGLYPCPYCPLAGSKNTYKRVIHLEQHARDKRDQYGNHKRLYAFILKCKGKKYNEEDLKYQNPEDDDEEDSWDEGFDDAPDPQSFPQKLESRECEYRDLQRRRWASRDLRHDTRRHSQRRDYSPPPPYSERRYPLPSYSQHRYPQSSSIANSQRRDPQPLYSQRQDAQHRSARSSSSQGSRTNAGFREVTENRERHSAREAKPNKKMCQICKTRVEMVKGKCRVCWQKSYTDNAGKKELRCKQCSSNICTSSLRCETCGTAYEGVVEKRCSQIPKKLQMKCQKKVLSEAQRGVVRELVREYVQKGLSPNNPLPFVEKLSKQIKGLKRAITGAVQQELQRYRTEMAEAKTDNGENEDDSDDDKPVAPKRKKMKTSSSGDNKRSQTSTGSGKKRKKRMRIPRKPSHVREHS